MTASGQPGTDAVAGVGAGSVLADRYLLEGVGATAGLGVIHRDVKPQNVLLTPDHQVKIIDFGIARGPAANEMTEPGWVLGTAHYLAPEVAAGRPATVQSDLYALGIVLFRLVTGRFPFE